MQIIAIVFNCLNHFWQIFRILRSVFCFIETQCLMKQKTASSFSSTGRKIYFFNCLLNVEQFAIPQRIKTPVVRPVIQSPEMKNQTFTPTCSAMGLLKSRPTGIVTEEIRVNTEKARPIFSGATVSCIYAVRGIVWTFPAAPRQIQAAAKTNHPP